MDSRLLFLCCINLILKTEKDHLCKSVQPSEKVFQALFYSRACYQAPYPAKKTKTINSPEPPPAAQRIKEFKTGEEFIRFDYNAAGDVNKVTINSDINTGGIDMTYTVNYDAGKKITSLDAGAEKIIPVYENNLLKRADIFQEGVRVGYTNYQFENGVIKRATIYFGEGNDFQPFLEFNFTYNAAGNITENVALMANGEPGHMERSGHINLSIRSEIKPIVCTT